MLSPEDISPQEFNNQNIIRDDFNHFGELVERFNDPELKCWFIEQFMQYHLWVFTDEERQAYTEQQLIWQKLDGVAEEWNALVSS